MYHFPGASDGKQRVKIRYFTEKPAVLLSPDLDQLRGVGQLVEVETPQICALFVCCLLFVV